MNNLIEALTLFSQNRNTIRLIMTDVMMPVMDGLALVRVVRKIDPEMKVIASSGLGHDAKFDELRTLGVDVFLTKPYTADKLLHSLRAMLAGEPVTHA